MFKKKYLLLTLFLIIIFQILLYTNNNQKTSFRYFKRDIRETQPTISVNYRVVKNMNDNNFKKDQSYSNQDIKDDWDNADNDW